MQEEKLTPEETEAFEAMESDTTEVTEPEREAAAPAETEEVAETTTEDVATEETPEFKSTRTEEKPPEGFVPHAAMHAERVKRQQLEADLAEIKEWRAAQEAKAAEASAPAFVDPLEDPDGFRRWAEYNATQTQSTIEQEKQTRVQTEQQQQRFQRAQTLEAEFAQKTPDYPKAAEYLHNARVSELRAQGFGDAEISSQIAKDANALFDAAENTNMNPAELLYYRATSMGYTKAAPAVEDTADEVAKLAATAAAQKNTQGLGSAGGAEQSGSLTMAQLADMSEAEIAKLPEDQVRAAMGG